MQNLSKMTHGGSLGLYLAKEQAIKDATMAYFSLKNYEVDKVFISTEPTTEMITKVFYGI